MKKGIRNISSLLLALMVMCSTLSFAVEKHYCMGEVVDISFFSKVKGCEMPVSSNTDSEPIMEMDCCSNVVELVESNNTNLKLDKVVSIEKIDFITIFYVSYYNLFIDNSIKRTYNTNYSPPLITKDVNILHETFLI